MRKGDLQFLGQCRNLVRFCHEDFLASGRALLQTLPTAEISVRSTRYFYSSPSLQAWVYKNAGRLLLLSHATRNICCNTLFRKTLLRPLLKRLTICVSRGSPSASSALTFFSNSTYASAEPSSGTPPMPEVNRRATFGAPNPSNITIPKR